MIVQVAVSGPFVRALDYMIDSPCVGAKVQLGMRVRVPFRSKHRIGLIVGVEQSTEFDVAKVRLVDELLDDVALFSSLELAFFDWIARYYHEPLGEVIMAALPKNIRAGEPLAVKGVESWRRSLLGQAVDVEQFAKNASKQRALWHAFSDNQAWL